MKKIVSYQCHCCSHVTNQDHEFCPACQRNEKGEYASLIDAYRFSQCLPATSNIFPLSSFPKK